MSTYDFIVIGAGSAGAALAYRLSENPQHKVLLLEAGRASYHWTRLPVGYAKMVSNPAVNWLYEGEPEEATNGRKLPMPRGKILGGSSSINGMGLCPRPGPGLRHLGPDGLPRLDLPRGSPLLQADGEL